MTELMNFFLGGRKHCGFEKTLLLHHTFIIAVMLLENLGNLNVCAIPCAQIMANKMSPETEAQKNKLAMTSQNRDVTCP